MGAGLEVMAVMSCECLTMKCTLVECPSFIVMRKLVGESVSWGSILSAALNRRKLSFYRENKLPIKLRDANVQMLGRHTTCHGPWGVDELFGK